LKASVYIAISLDGFIARENGDLDWLSGSESAGTSEDYGFHEFLDSIDTLVMGRKTFEVVVASGQWPYGNIPDFPSAERSICILTVARRSKVSLMPV